ncbi:MAG TPA: bifunctional DNA-formamidopyrimidine glycosylase/DNA-(apurinic or apyrimidinic site) lyase [Candidatus Saccharimonadales bacterium]|nr:bifunctional DNA-formamidopyrimidine glycosylase/DNA-(apurinic or apyrimidinic site) lyase [Candidatus Saccharimonadales bacterium]
MPELPEVETIRAGLAELLPGRRVKAVEHDWPKAFPNSEADVREFIVGAEIKTVRRRAKVLIMELPSGYSLVIHLKMTGQLVFRAADIRFGAGHPSDSLVGDLPDKSTRVTLDFADGSRLFFNDQRKFGWMRLVPTAQVARLDFFKKIGPEPLEKGFTAKVLEERAARRRKSNVKSVLMDQTVLAGVGNIYADEALWGAKIHPAALVKDLGPADFRRLYKELLYVLKLAIDKGGSTDRNYVDVNGRRGSYLGFARVFRREGQPCPRCGTDIIKIRVAGRGTHVCPKCQQA